MFKRISLVCMMLLLVSMLVGSFHYHVKGADHPECPICAASRQQADIAPAIPVFEIFTHFVETSYPAPVALVTKIVFSLFSNRAPPA